MTRRELAPRRWDGLRHWERDEHPLRELRREMDRLFEDAWRGGGWPARLSEAWNFGDVWPRIDETEDDKAYHILAELPGVDDKDIEITLSDGLLTIRGEKKEEKEEKGRGFYQKERAFGSFRRTVPVPGEVDDSKIQATFKKGVLTIDLPKTAEAQKKVKRISVKAA